MATDAKYYLVWGAIIVIGLACFAINVWLGIIAVALFFIGWNIYG